MTTLFGKKAQEGDYVLVQDLNYIGKTAKIYPAKVHNDKAYSSTIIKRKGVFVWLRKQTAICIIAADDLTEAQLYYIENNINSKTVTYEGKESWMCVNSQVLPKGYKAK